MLLSLCLTFDKQVFLFPVEAINATDVQENNANIIKNIINNKNVTKSCSVL